MFKRIKRANFRRRNESDEDEREENVQPMLAPTLFGPVLEEVPFLETSSGSNDVSLSPRSNGFGVNFKSARRDKKAKDGVPVLGPTKASLLSFDDEEEEGTASVFILVCEGSVLCRHFHIVSPFGF